MIAVEALPSPAACLKVAPSISIEAKMGLVYILFRAQSCPALISLNPRRTANEVKA